MEKELVQLPRFHRVRLDARHQLRANVVEVPNIACEIAENYVVSACGFTYKGVIDWHPVYLLCLSSIFFYKMEQFNKILIKIINRFF